MFVICLSANTAAIHLERSILMKHLHPAFGQIMLVFVLAACNTAAPAPAETVAPQPVQVTETHAHTAEPLTTPETAGQPLAWQDLPLADVRTGDSFKLSDFAGRVVLLEIIAPGCAPCATQIKEVGAALEALSDDIVAISVDYSAYSKPANVAAYADTLEAGWSFAVTTKEFRAALVSEFGPGVVVVSATPIIVIKPSGATHFTEPGIKTSSTLVTLVNEYSP
jgi:hypothetical protein